MKHLQTRRALIIAASLVCVIALQPQKAASFSVRDARVGHETFEVALNAAALYPALMKDLKAVSTATFGSNATTFGDETPLVQFVSTVSAQAKYQNWRSLHVDVWTAGKSAASGFLIEYRATDSNGQPVIGRGLIITDKSVIPQLAEYGITSP